MKNYTNKNNIFILKLSLKSWRTLLVLRFSEKPTRVQIRLLTGNYKYIIINCRHNCSRYVMVMKPTRLNGCSLCSIGCFLRFKWGHCMLIFLGFPGSRLCPFKCSFILDDETPLVFFDRKKHRIWRAHIITVHTTIKIARPWKHPIFLRVTKCLLFSICCTGCC